MTAQGPGYERVVHRGDPRSIIDSMDREALGPMLSTRYNSIGFLRLLAAVMVIVGHSFKYGGFGGAPLAALTHNQLAEGRLPVDVFFILSGFLIAQSYDRLGSLPRFLWHRLLRIFPALAVCLLLTSTVVATWLGSGPDLGYAVHNLPLIFGIRDSIAGVFVATPGQGSVNSALWTLPWEIGAYAMIGLLGIAGLLGRRRVVMGLLAGTWATFVIQIFMHPGIATSPAVTSGMRLLTMFLAGTLCYLERERIPVRGSLFAASIAVMVAGTVAGILWFPFSAGVFYAIAPLPLAYVVLYLAARLPFQRINTRWDLSYGTYIYGTLMLNMFAALGLNLAWLPYIAAVLATTLLIAMASWVLIERPALALKGWSLRQLPQQEPAPGLGDRRLPGGLDVLGKAEVDRRVT
jgi:peptidoglycan/LPS O-acetylase OafA/YrhL